MVSMFGHLCLKCRLLCSHLHRPVLKLYFFMFKLKRMLFSFCRYLFQTKKQLDGNRYWGQLATYSGGGYVQDLSKTKNETTKIIDALFDNLWIDRGTRVVFIDFTVYNANINLFCVVR